MSEGKPPEDDGEAPFDFGHGISLGADGTVERPISPSVPPRDRPPAASRGPEPDSLELARPLRSARPADEALELANPVEHADKSPEETRALPEGLVTEAQLRRRRRVFILVAMALLVGGLFTLLGPGLRKGVPGVSMPPAELLIVDSEPSGATVVIAGKVVGQTPLAMDNVWPPGAVPIEIRAKGFKPWRGSIRGREAQRIEAALQR